MQATFSGAVGCRTIEPAPGTLMATVADTLRKGSFANSSELAAPHIVEHTVEHPVASLSGSSTPSVQNKAGIPEAVQKPYFSAVDKKSSHSRSNRFRSSKSLSPEAPVPAEDPRSSMRAAGLTRKDLQL